MQKIIFSLFLFLISISTSAQQSSSFTDPSGYRWLEYKDDFSASSAYVLSEYRQANDAFNIDQTKNTLSLLSGKVFAQISNIKEDKDFLFRIKYRAPYNLDYEYSLALLSDSAEILSFRHEFKEDPGMGMEAGNMVIKYLPFPMIPSSREMLNSTLGSISGFKIDDFNLLEIQRLNGKGSVLLNGKVISGRNSLPMTSDLLYMELLPKESNQSIIQIDIDFISIAFKDTLNKEPEIAPAAAIVVPLPIPPPPPTKKSSSEEWPPEDAVAANYHALIIGNNNYENRKITDLDQPILDAQKLYDVLVNRYTFDKSNVIFLKDATRGTIIEALDSISDYLTEDDNLLIFYAGHGHWDEKKESGYWLPVDASNKSTADWLRNSTIQGYIESIDAKHTLLIADACFGGGIFKTRAAFADASKSINNLYRYPSRKAMTSGMLNEVPDKSVFMENLIERLNDNSEKYLPSMDLFMQFRENVMNNSSNAPQYGTIHNTGDKGGDFIFILK